MIGMPDKTPDETTECTFMRRLRQTLAQMELHVACVKKKRATRRKRMDSDAQIFLATSLSLSSVLIGVISLAVKSQCEEVNLRWGCVQCRRKAKRVTLPPAPPSPPPPCECTV